MRLRSSLTTTFGTRTLHSALLLSCAFVACSKPTHVTSDAGVPPASRDGGTVGSDAGTPDAGPAPTITRVVLTPDTTASTSSGPTPVTFGQVFAPGDVPAGRVIAARLPGGAGVVPLQTDAKATHPDGSLRHAVLTALLPSPPPAAGTTLELIAADAPTGASPQLSALLATGFDAAVQLTLAGGGTVNASAAALLKAGTPETWLAGPLVTEWRVAGPLLDANGAPHPLLRVRFGVRAFTGSPRVRVEVTVESDLAFAPPSNVQYDASIQLNGATAFTATGLTHYAHSRWRQVLWTPDAPAVFVHEDPSYVIGTRAVASYDPAVHVSESVLQQVATQWSSAHSGPMQIGLATAYMPQTGGRPDIGLLPAWAVVWLLSQDPRAAAPALGTADGAGTWSMHYRDAATDRPISIDDYPDLTILGTPGDTHHPFPACAGDCKSPFTYDTSHTPELSYLPYLLTGERYYLDELEFAADYPLFESNPGYRSYSKGLLHSSQVRGQAWSLRTLGEAAYIVPDADPMKAYFIDKVHANIDDYTQRFVGPNATEGNALGLATTGTAIVYDNNTGTAPWQDAFFTSAVGRLVELGFTSARPLLDFKARFQIGIMTAPGFCWIDATSYTLDVRPSATAPLYDSFAEVWTATIGDPVDSVGVHYTSLPCGSQAMADWLTQNDKDMGTARGPWAAGEMKGYADAATGYPSNLQPGLAFAASTDLPNAQQAWTIFAGRSVKPDYSAEPQFAIVPRPLPNGPDVGGGGTDGGTAVDGGTPDAGSHLDAGSSVDAGQPDAGAGSDIDAGVCTSGPIPPAPGQNATGPAPFACPANAAITDIDAALAALAPASWLELPCTQMANVCPMPYDHYACSAVMGAWSGGAYDTTNDRLIVSGGGHSDSWLNNVFAFDLGTVSWKRWTELPTGMDGTNVDPTLQDKRVETCGLYPKVGPLCIPNEWLTSSGYLDPSHCDDPFIAGQLDQQQPRSRHTYGDLAFSSATGRFYMLGAAGLYPSGQASASRVDVFDFATGRWARAANNPDAGYGTSATDALGRIWYFNTDLWLFDPSANTWTPQHTKVLHSYYGAADVDTKRNVLALTSDGTAVSTYAIGTPGAPYTEVTTQGLTAALPSQGGLAYAPPLDRYVWWSGGQTVWMLNPTTWTWTAFQGSGADPGGPSSTGTYGRWRYSPKRGVFVAVSATTTNVFVFKPPAQAP